MMHMVQIADAVLTLALKAGALALVGTFAVDYFRQRKR